MSEIKILLDGVQVAAFTLPPAAPLPTYNAPATVPSSPPQKAQAGHDCPDHGPMEFKQGTSKAGNAYAGWFCAEEGCTTPPQWAKTR